MTRAVRVAVESPLLQLDREFDFLAPEELGEVVIGQRVSFPFGRSKKLQTGFVLEVLHKSDFAKTALSSIVDPRPVLHSEVFAFARKVADRQCVALGEILAAAVPDHMPRVRAERSSSSLPSSSNEVVSRRALLTAGRQVKVSGQYVPEWALKFAEAAKDHLASGRSSILLVPEESDVEMLSFACQDLQLANTAFVPSDKKSQRFQKFHALFDQVAVVIGTRSAIYSPVANLGLIAVSDDLDESYREVGSPHTHLRDLALIRAGDDVDLLFASPYRSVEIQRLIEIGYLSEMPSEQKPLRISFTDPGLRVDESAFRLVREGMSAGPLLVLLPRKGVAAAIWCAGCGERQRCNCGGFVWEPEAGQFKCRICNRVHLECSSCRSREFRSGRKGSSRTLAEIGRAFPKATVMEATADKKPSNLGKPNQILISTPGSAPRLKDGYSGLVILDPDVWLTAQNLQAESFAIRDWCEAMELLNPAGRVVISGIGAELGQPISLWQHTAIAKRALADSRQLGLPPAVRSVSVSGTNAALDKVVTDITTLGARLLRKSDQEALLTFSYQLGPAVSKALRGHALATNARGGAGNRRRGLKIAMDPLGEI